MREALSAARSGEGLDELWVAEGARNAAVADLEQQAKAGEVASLESAVSGLLARVRAVAAVLQQEVAA